MPAAFKIASLSFIWVNLSFYSILQWKYRYTLSVYKYFTRMSYQHYQNNNLLKMHVIFLLHMYCLNTVFSGISQIRASDCKGVYVGASDIQVEGEFKWNDGRSVQELPWHSGEPNDGTFGNCLVTYSGLGLQFRRY